jgi:hypothetical protein
VVSFADAVTRTAIFSDLSWDASYEVVVMALNESGRAESAPVSFEVPMTDPPALTGLYSPLPASSWYYPDGGPDPTCLVVEWEFASLAESYRIALSGMSGGETFDVIVPAYPTETSICAADHPIVDGMNYRAQVFAVQGDEELGSNSREYTIDFDMGYPATGTWLLVWYDMGYQAEITLELEDRDGEISGSWTTVSRIWENGVWQEYTDVWSVTGRRLGLAVELTLDKAAAGSDAFAGYFDGPDRLRLSLYKPPFTFTLLSFDRR